MLGHLDGLDGLDAQLSALEHELSELATREPWSDPVRWLELPRNPTCRILGRVPRGAVDTSVR